MKIAIYLMLTLCFVSEVLGDANASNTSSVLHDMNVAEFTSTGSTIIEHCVFSNTLTNNGSADIRHSKVKHGVIHGPLTSYGLDAHSITVYGAATISDKSDIEELYVSGPLYVNDSYTNVVVVNGIVNGKGAFIKKITVNGTKAEFTNSDLGMVFINRSDLKLNPIDLKILGTTTIRHLTIDSNSNPSIIISLDKESKKTFDKSIVQSNGKVEYRWID